MIFLKRTKRRLNADIIAVQKKDKQIGAKRLIVLSASLSDSEREVGESKGRGQRPQSLCVFCTVVILFKLFLDCYSIRACLKIEENDGFFTQNG